MAKNKKDPHMVTFITSGNVESHDENLFIVAKPIEPVTSLISQVQNWYKQITKLRDKEQTLEVLKKISELEGEITQAGVEFLIVCRQDMAS